LENLRTEADLAPLPRARFFRTPHAGLRNLVCWNAGRAVAQEDQYAPPFFLESAQRCVDRARAAEKVAAHVSAMKPRQHALAVSDPAIDESHMLDRVERRHVSKTLQSADFGFDGEFADPLDQLVTNLPVGNE